MTDIVRACTHRILIVTGVAVVWLAFFKLNAFAFSYLEHSSRAHWIFLPAALRVISVLLFEEAGVVGLMLGAYFTLPHDDASSLPYELLLSASSAIAPLIAIWSCQRFFKIANNLAGLRGHHIAALSIVSAVANSIVLNASMAIVGKLHGDWNQVVTIFVGDMLGAATLLSVLAVLASLTAKRVAKGGKNGA